MLTVTPETVPTAAVGRSGAVVVPGFCRLFGCLGSFVANCAVQSLQQWPGSMKEAARDHLFGADSESPPFGSSTAPQIRAFPLMGVRVTATLPGAVSVTS